MKAHSEGVRMMKPNWKNADEYKFPPNTSLDRWAWEFLRRNESFYLEIEAAKKEPLPKAAPVGWSQTPIGEVLVKWGVKHPMLPEWVRRGLSDSQLIFEKYPRSVSSYKVTTIGGPFTEKALGHRFCVALESQEKMVLEFDLAAPINPQIERAKKMLETQQKSDNQGKVIVKKAIVSLYPEYLRILDAIDADATHAEMMGVFAAEYSAKGLGDDTLSKRMKEAKRMRDVGYRDLVTSPTPP